MMPRYAADYRTILWVALGTTLVFLQIARPELVPYLCWLSCYFALTCGVIAHNHNHCPTFASKRENEIFANWLTLLYGYPTFAWIPTHNLNHHKYVNRAGDATITWRYTNAHGALVAATYFFVSSYWQSDPIKAFIRKARASNPKVFRRIVTQYAVLVTVQLTLLGTCIALHGVKTGLLTWIFACLIPALFALWTIMLFNYEMHVHADPWSKHNHSRTWDGKVVNFLLFNNGLHTAHHENPGLHWSKLWTAHERIANEIDPRLVEHNVLWYFFRQYALAPLFPRFGSVQVGRAPFDPPDGAAVDLTSADVELGEAGTNAAMLDASAR